MTARSISTTAISIKFDCPLFISITFKINSIKWLLLTETFISKRILLRMGENMSEVELTKVSSKGQVVIPQGVREELGLKEGETLAVMGRDDTILLKRVALPSAKEAFEKIHKWGVEFARRKGITEKDIIDLVVRVRKQ